MYKRRLESFENFKAAVIFPSSMIELSEKIYIIALNSYSNTNKTLYLLNNYYTKNILKAERFNNIRFAASRIRDCFLFFNDGEVDGQKGQFWYPIVKVGTLKNGSIKNIRDIRTLMQCKGKFVTCYYHTEHNKKIICRIKHELEEKVKNGIAYRMVFIPVWSVVPYYICKYSRKWCINEKEAFYSKYEGDFYKNFKQMYNFLNNNQVKTTLKIEKVRLTEKNNKIIKVEKI